MDCKRRIARRPTRVCVRIAGFVLPGLKVHRLGWTDTKEDSQNFRVRYSLSKRRVEAGATLLDKGEVEARREGNCLDQAGVARVRISSGNRCVFPTIQTRNSQIEYSVTEIGVLAVGTVPTPITGVDGEFREIGEPSLHG